MPVITKYKATRALSIYRKIQCEACDQVFEYSVTEEFESEHTARSIFTERLAEKQSKEDVQKAYDERVKVLKAQGNNAVIEAKPCPNCGYYQSYMEMANQSQGWLFTFGGIVLLLLALWFTKENGVNILTIILVPMGVILLPYGVYLLATPLNQKWLKEHGKTKRDVPPPRKPIETKIISTKSVDTEAQPSQQESAPIVPSASQPAQNDQQEKRRQVEESPSQAQYEQQQRISQLDKEISSLNQEVDKLNRQMPKLSNWSTIFSILLIIGGLYTPILGSSENIGVFLLIGGISVITGIGLIIKRNNYYKKNKPVLDEIEKKKQHLLQLVRESQNLKNAGR